MKQASRKQNSHVIDLLFTLALFCVFAASALLVVLIGANVYTRTIDGMTRNFEMGTSMSYVTTKIRQHDAEDAVSFSQIDGIDALVLEQDVDWTIYQTWIYHYDGGLYELFTEKGNLEFLTPEEGQRILSVEDFTFELTGDGLIRLRARQDGVASEQLITLRSA